MQGDRPTIFLPALLLLCAFALASCTPAIRVSRLQPAPYNKAAMLTNISITPFTGPGADTLTNRVEEILSGIKVDGKTFFSTKMEGGLYYGSRAKELGTAGGYGILSGIVTRSRCSVEQYTQERTRCIESKNNGTARECVRWSHYRVDCFKSTAEFGLSLQLREKKSGEVVYSLFPYGSKTSSACNSAPRAGNATDSDFKGRLNSIFGVDKRYGYLRCEYWTKKRLLGAAINSALVKAEKKIRNDIAPHYVTVRLELMASEEGIESEEAKQGLKEGLEFAKNMRMLKAEQSWLKAYPLAPLSLSINYNLGLSAEFFGRFKEALILYKKAGGLNKDSNRLVASSIKRVEGIVKKNRELNRQMKSR